MRTDKGRRTSSTGPLTFDYESAETLGWSEEMISEAVQSMHVLFVKYTNKSGICCPHCEKYIPRPEGGFPCGEDVKKLVRELLRAAINMGLTTKSDSDALAEVYALMEKHLT